MVRDPLFEMKHNEKYITSQQIHSRIPKHIQYQNIFIVTKIRTRK